MDVLPEELLLIILQELPLDELVVFETVCKSWHFLIRNILSKCETIELEALDEINWDCYTLVRLLNLCGQRLRVCSVPSRFIASDVFSAMGSHCNLQEINFNKCVFDISDFASILPSLPLLHTLSLELANHGEITEESVSVLLSQMPSLVSLNLCQQYYMLGRFLRHFASKSLCQLKLSDCTFVPMGLVLVSEMFAQTLRIFWLTHAKTDSDALYRLCEVLGSTLESLAISRTKFSCAPRAGDPSLLCLGMLRNLRELHASSVAPAVHSGIVLEIADNCSLLTHLCLSSGTFSDAAVWQLGALRQLEHLDISDNAAITDNALVSLRCEKLRKLFCCHCQALRGDFVAPVLSACTSLVHLGLARCRHMLGVVVGGALSGFVRNRDQLEREDAALGATAVGIQIYLYGSNVSFDLNFLSAAADVNVFCNFSSMCDVHHCCCATSRPIL